MNFMPEDYQNYENYENYGDFDHREQNLQHGPQSCNKCEPLPSAENEHGYYDYSGDQNFNNSVGECDSQLKDFNDCNAPTAAVDYCRPCPESCQLPMCSPFKKRRYVQPPRRQSFRPNATYQKPSIPMSNETIYRKSFEGVDSSTAFCCRPPPFNPSGFLRIPGGAFEKETITKMSFQPFCGVQKCQPIKHSGADLLGKGPMQALTTQKHDFVPKFQFRRQRIVPRDNISKSCGCMEKCSVQKLSFLPPCSVARTKSFKPISHYKKPDLPMEFETTQKLSYMPVQPRPKENMPWAMKASYLPPTLPFAKDTVTKLSFQPPGCFEDECYCCEEGNNAC